MGPCPDPVCGTFAFMSSSGCPLGPCLLLTLDPDSQTGLRVAGAIRWKLGGAHHPLCMGRQKESVH